MKQIFVRLFAVFAFLSLATAIHADSSVSDISCIAGKLDTNSYSIEVFAPHAINGILRSVELIKGEENADSIRIPLAPHATNSEGVFIYIKIDEHLFEGASIRVTYESPPPE